MSKTWRFTVQLIIGAALTWIVTPCVSAASDPYRSWAERSFGLASVANAGDEGTRWGEEADPDGDGLSNLLEYALGLDPLSPSIPPKPVSLPVPWLTGDRSAFVISATIRADDPDLVIFPQVSADNAVWFPLAFDRTEAAQPDSFYTVKVDETFPSHGMRQVVWATRPAIPGLDPHFMRLTALRQSQLSPATASRSAAPAASIPAAQTLAVQASTPSIPGLSFTGQLNAAIGGDLISNTVTLSGFSGSIVVTAPAGVTLIVNGKAMGQSATVKAGDTLALRATSPAQPDQPVTYAIKFANGATANWVVGSKRAPALTAPAGTVAGYTPVNASVGPGGDANISLPITVSPGIAGMEPKLSIVYNSQGGNGLLGVGFNLGGLSAITRVGATVVQDGFRGSVKLNASDRFALDGARLISVQGPEGGHNTFYRKELDDFSRIRVVGNAGSGPATWKVETKAGLTYEYGGHGSQAVRLDNRPEVLVWPLVKISDTVGNEIWFTYTVTNGTYRISRVDYTCRGGIANNPTHNSVAFTYEPRPDVRTGYVLGSRVVVDQRLKAIGSLHGDQIVRHYTLTYRQSSNSGASQLIQVQERGQKLANGAWPSFEPTTFTWNQASDPTSTLVQGTTENGLGQMGFSKSPPSFTIQGDFNGDGRMDIMQLDDHGGPFSWMALGQANGSFQYLGGVIGFSDAETVFQDSGNLRTGDFNGDGRTDLFYISQDGKRNWIALANSVKGFDLRRAGELGTLQGIGFSSGYTQVLTLDVNGDGRTDIVVINPSDSRNLPAQVFLSNGDGSFTSKDPGAAFKALRVTDTRPSYQWVLPGDFNGDGLADILLLYYAGSHFLALSNGDGTFEVRDSSQLGGLANKSFSVNYSYMVGMDVNGDGLTDVLNFNSAGGAWQALCKGDGTFETPTNPAALQGTNTADPQYSQFLTGDFNGDGAADLFEPYTGHPDLYFLAYGSMAGIFNPQRGSALGALAGLTTYDPEHTAASRIYIGDFDGDGRDDALDINYNKDNYLARSNGFAAERVDRVTNGHGGYTRFVYNPMTNPSVYGKGTGATYPAVDFVAPIHVVSEMFTRNGVDGDAETPNSSAPTGESGMSYQYYESVAYLNGRGLQGPRTVRQINETTGIQIITTRETSHPLLSSFPKQVVTRLSDGTLVNETNNTWVLQPRTSTANHKTYFAFTSESVTQTYDINTHALVKTTTTTVPTSNGFDGNGNLLKSATTVSGGGESYGTSTVNTYSDTISDSKWFLGRLATSKVTRTAPGVPDSTRSSSFRYNAATGLVGVESIEPDNLKLRIDKVYLRDAFGNITDSNQTAWNGQGTPALNQTRSKHTDYSKDGRFVTRTRNALSHEETTEHEGLLGQVFHQTGPNKVETFWEFDSFGRPIHEIRADGTETRSWYLRAVPGENGAPARAVHAVVTKGTASPAQTVWFDILDREIRRDAAGFSGEAIVMGRVFNERGETIRISNPRFSGQAPSYAEVVFDAIGREIQRTRPGGFVTTTAYNGLTTTVTNSEHQTLTRTATVQDKLSDALDDDQHPLTYSHDAVGNLSGVTDGGGHATKITYDNRGNKISMVEPNTGTTKYEYNGFGELVAQTNASGQRTTFSYDLLGRLVKRVEPEGNTTWTYDKFPDRSPGEVLTGNSIGKLVRSEQGDFREDHLYDRIGRPVEMVTVIKTEIFRTRTTYDYAGRVDTITYPTSFAIRNVYNASGHLAGVQNAAAGSSFWTPTVVNFRGQVERETLGNGLVTKRVFDPNTGWVGGISTGAGAGNLNEVQNLTFNRDSIGNLTTRQDVARGITETFGHDEVNRVTDATITGATADFGSQQYTYDQFGNPTSRTDAGTFSYGGAGPHAITSLTQRPGGAPDLRYSYDVRGNRTKTERKEGAAWVTDLSIGYTTANLTSILTTPKPRAGQPIVTTTFNYGPDRARYRQIEEINGVIYLGRLYIGSLYEREKRFASGNLTATRHVHYIPAGGSVVAIKQTEEGVGAAFAERTLYVHKDHLGSVESITDQKGTLLEHLNYDVWGRRRDASFANGTYSLAYKANNPSVPINTARGFTGHEMLDAFGLVHMNGRVYDPLTGRFLSADPVVQELDNLQNLNRYSYVLNNPLSATDPSGFLFGGIGKFFKKHWIAIVSAVIGVVTAGAALAAFAGFEGILAGSTAFLTGAVTTGEAVLAGAFAGFSSAFTGTLLSGGSLGDAFRAGITGGVIGGVSAGIFQKIDVNFPDWLHTRPALDQPMITAGRLLNQVERMAFRGVASASIAHIQGGKIGSAFWTSVGYDGLSFAQDTLMEAQWREEASGPNHYHLGEENEIENAHQGFATARKDAEWKPAQGEAVRHMDTNNFGTPPGEIEGMTEGKYAVEKAVGVLRLHGATEGSSFSNFMSFNVPGMHQISIFHDFFITAAELPGKGLGVGVANNVLNWGSMIPYAGLVYGGYLQEQETRTGRAGR